MQENNQRLKVLSAGVLSLVLTLGIARFAYTPLLPLMQEQAGLGVTEGGTLAAFNYMGYLSGALLASFINDLILKDRLYRIGLVISVLTTLGMGLTTNLWVWEVLRFLAGLSSAAGLLFGSGLILNWLLRHNHPSELGIHFGGTGVGIALGAISVEVMSPWFDWQTQWILFSVLGAILLIPALRWLPPPDSSSFTRTGVRLVDTPPSPLFMRLFMAAYFCAGMGYVISATFIVAVIEEQPELAGRGALVFLVLGLAATPACIIWDLIARRTGEVLALIGAALLQIVGILLPIWMDGLVWAFLGAILFGGTFIGIVSLVLTMAGRYYPTRPAKMMGRMTVAYGVAQILGPALTGWLAGQTGSYAQGLYMAAGVMVVGTLLLIILRQVELADKRRLLAQQS
ncbi:MAG: YbfB/YjiJ family MFS transporter [Magnetococcales bacterium]|nr:YbfB/YjiJ family MFS transporter [Magnetococcales bacterium]